MFAGSYFAASYFAPRYFPRAATTATTPTGRQHRRPAPVTRLSLDGSAASVVRVYGWPRFSMALSGVATTATQASIWLDLRRWQPDQSGVAPAPGSSPDEAVSREGEVLTGRAAATVAITGWLTLSMAVAGAVELASATTGSLRTSEVGGITTERGGVIAECVQAWREASGLTWELAAQGPMREQTETVLWRGHDEAVVCRESPASATDERGAYAVGTQRDSAGLCVDAPDRGED